MLQFIGTVSIGALLLIWIACRLRLLPDSLMRVYFGICIACGFLCLYVACTPLHLLSQVGLISKRFLNAYSIILTGVMLRTVRFLNPQQRVFREYSRFKWEQVPKNAHVIVNHCSFWDSLQYCCEQHLDKCSFKKTLMKSSLSKMPIAGRVMFDCIGVFPVYFASEAAQEFSVDKEKQAAVTAEIEKWNKAGNSLCYCPEGKMSDDPFKVQPLRFGSVKMLAESGQPIFFNVMLNNHVFWNLGAPVGGNAADLAVSLVEYKYKDGKEPIPRDASGAVDVAKFGEDCRAFMQRELDRLREIHTEYLKGKKSA